MAWIPSIKLYQSNGTTPVYTFQYVLDLPDLLTDNPDYVELTNKRGAGSIIIPGGNKPYDFRIKGILRASNYENLFSAMNSLKTAVVNNTQYVLKIDKTSTTTENINVVRIAPISWEGPAKKTTIQYYTITFRALSWS